jgi:hypothetical protein
MSRPQAVQTNSDRTEGAQRPSEAELIVVETLFGLAAEETGFHHAE